MSSAGLRRPLTVHATALLVRDAGVLVRGPSGSGKSTLARQLLDGAERDGRFARLVSDDRTILEARNGRLIARPVPAVAGRLEVRGIGLVPLPHEAACVVRLVVDLGSGEPRLPEPEDCEVEIEGVRLPRLALLLPGAEDRVLWRLRGLGDTIMTAR